MIVQDIETCVGSVTTETVIKAYPVITWVPNSLLHSSYMGRDSFFLPSLVVISRDREPLLHVVAQEDLRDRKHKTSAWINPRSQN